MEGRQRPSCRGRSRGMRYSSPPPSTAAFYRLPRFSWWPVSSLATYHITMNASENPYASPQPESPTQRTGPIRRVLLARCALLVFCGAMGGAGIAWMLVRCDHDGGIRGWQGDSSSMAIAAACGAVLASGFALAPCPWYGLVSGAGAGCGLSAAISQLSFPGSTGMGANGLHFLFVVLPLTAICVGACGFLGGYWASLAAR